MSSTNSSDCDSCEWSQCTFEINHNERGQCMTSSRHVPIYATMAHPLIYYAQVQPINRRQNRDQPKKDNPFMKAFKWYTQERKAICSENECAPERGGFASWLDSKYCEYLRDSDQQPTSNEPRAPNTPKQTRKFRRFKSPWRKRTCPAKDSGDVPQKCPDGSWEYILKPKELSRAASENCYHSRTSAGKSNATIISSHTPCNTEWSRRSQSLSDISREKYVYNKHVETVTLTMQKGTNVSCECPQQQIVLPPMTKWKQNYLQQKVPEAVQVPSKQQDSINEAPCTCEKEKVPELVKVKSKEQESRNQEAPSTCTCQKEKVPELVKVKSKEQESRSQEAACTCTWQKEKVPELVKVKSKEQDSRNQEARCTCICQKEKVPELVKVKSKEQESGNQEAPCTCKCQKEKVPELVKVKSKEQDSRNQEAPCKCTWQKKTVLEPVKVKSKEQESRNQRIPCCTVNKEIIPIEVIVSSKQLDSRNKPEPPCTCEKEEVPTIVKEPSKAQDLINQPVAPSTCQKANIIVTEPSKEQYSMNQPVALCCKCSQEKALTVVKLPSYYTDPSQVVEVQLEKIPEVVKVLSYHEGALQVVEVQQETIPKVVKVPSKAQESTYKLCCKYEKKNVPKEVQVPSVDQDRRNLPGPCCICHVKKVPEVVQVPSQCRAIEESCQCSEKKAVAVCEETQYETAPTPLRSAQNHGPCCCNTCKPAPPLAREPEQPQLFCQVPVKVQDRKISSPDICVAPSVQRVSLPKKQKKVKQYTTVATQCGEGIQSKVSSQCQHEIYVCGKDNRSSCNCYDERQVCGSIPIKRESYSTVAVNKETGEYSITKEVAVVNKLTRCLTCASNGAAQTSDHSIRFENDGACSSFPHPLLLKIVYADVAKIE